MGRRESVGSCARDRISLGKPGGVALLGLEQDLGIHLKSEIPFVRNLRQKRKRLTLDVLEKRVEGIFVH